MKNIFDGAKFGDKFLTRDNRLAIYHYSSYPFQETSDKVWHHLIVDSIDDNELICISDGLCIGNHIEFPEWDDDIVSKYNINSESPKELHITNEEKARELFQSIPQCPYHIQYDETIENFTSIQLCELLEEMAKWKDEQLNEIVQKAWELFQQYATYMHPRKDIEMCVMNKQQFLKALNYGN